MPMEYYAAKQCSEQKRIYIGKKDPKTGKLIEFLTYYGINNIFHFWLSILLLNFHLDFLVKYVHEQVPMVHFHLSPNTPNKNQI